MLDMKLLHTINDIRVVYAKEHTPEREYICVAPDGRLLEEFATKRDATEWAMRTLDFVGKVTP